MARKATYDPDKVKDLRMEVINAALLVMTESAEVKKWSQYKKDLIMKMAPRVLPVLQEVSGRDGEPLQVVVPQAVANTFGIHGTDTETNAGNTEQGAV